MSICVGDSESGGAAVFAAPLCARDIVQRQRRGVDDPPIAPRVPPRRGPRAVHAPPALAVGPARARAKLARGEAPRLQGVVTIREAKRREGVFSSAVCDVLAAVGISAKGIAGERSRMSEISFGRTHNRSLLGTLNDFAFMAQQGNANRAEPDS